MSNKTLKGLALVVASAAIPIAAAAIWFTPNWLVSFAWVMVPTNILLFMGIFDLLGLEP